MYLGEIVEIIERDNVGKTPVHPYAKALFSAIPQVDQKGALTLLEGEIPSPIDLPLGCKFSTRCPYMQETCLQKSPTLDRLANGNAVRCHFASSIQKGDIQ
ncbi:oligopeptide/dipeptide ABC transporter ATP-binding protein [Sporosarcina sp. ITBMC105]